MTNENGKFCLHCGKALVDKQTKYCSDSHRQAFNRSKRKRSTDQTNGNTDQTTAQTDNSIVLFEEVKRDLARSEGMVVTLQDERDKLRQDLASERNKVEALQHDNGVLAGKLEAMETIQASSAEPIPTTNHQNIALWVGVLALILFLVWMGLQLG